MASVGPRATARHAAMVLASSLAVVILTLTPGGSAAWAHDRSQAVPTNAACTVSAAAGSPVVIGLEDQIDNGLTVPVCIDHQGPFHLLIDTGANATALDLSLASRLHLADVGSSRLFFGVGRSEQGQPVQVPNWSVGHVALAPQLVVAFKSHFPAGVDGLLGSDVLSRFGTIRLDYGAGQLVVAHGEGPPIGARTITGHVGEPLPAAFAAYQPQGVLPLTVVDFDGTSVATIAVDIGTKIVHLEIDSGADTSAIALSHLKGLGLRSEGHTKIVGLGGTSNSRVVRVKAWSLGLVPLVPQSLITLTLPGTYHVKVDGLFGADVLSQFSAVTIDYADGTLGLDQFPVV